MERAAHDRRADHHAAAAGRLPAAGEPVVVCARAARPGGRGAPRDRRLRDVGHQAGLGLQLRLPARPVHRDRSAGRRTLALAVVLADVESGRRSEPRTITITVKAMPEGFLSTHLVGGVAPGTIVRLAAPQGNFVMPDPAPASVLFITAGSGITPVMSMLRTLARREQITDVVHLHSAPTEADVMFARRAGRAGADPAGLPVTAAYDPHAGPPRSVQARRRGARLAGSADLGLRAGGHAQRRGKGMDCRRRCRAAASGAIRGIPRRAARAGRHRRIRQERQDRGSGRRDIADGRR